jgi:hypothetical protein
MRPLTPHSKEWFTALEKCSPDQAAMTKQIISLAQSSEVCGVCGDDPAQDYEVLGVNFAQGTPATIRLCDDCKSIRARMHGERFRAI